MILVPCQNQVFTFDSQDTSLSFFKDQDGNIWAKSTDIARVLNIKKIRQNVSKLPEKWKHTYKEGG